jgi:uncharacterized protein
MLVSVRLSLIAHPGAHRERVELLPDGVLAVWVRARPVEGQANAAIERVIADALQLRRREVKIVAGDLGRRKIVEVDLPALNELRTRLAYHEKSWQ